jgi:hypothetical protein
MLRLALNAAALIARIRQDREQFSCSILQPHRDPCHIHQPPTCALGARAYRKGQMTANQDWEKYAAPNWHRPEGAGHDCCNQADTECARRPDPRASRPRRGGHGGPPPPFSLDGSPHLKSPGATAAGESAWHL